VPRLPGAKGCKTFWVYSTCLCLRHIGDVTVILSKRGRNLGPKQTKILVTNLDEWIPRQVVSAYQRRWPVEQINRELKIDLGLGAHQVRGEEGRIEKSFGIAVLAYLFGWAHQATLGALYSRNAQSCSSHTGQTSSLPQIPSQLLGLSQSQSDQSSPDDSETCTASCERLCHGVVAVHSHHNLQRCPGGWLPDESAEKAAKHLPTVARDDITVTIALA
jgi:Transposase DDE domain